ncbi:MAG: phosphoribosylanthranilate isomerase [Candidatus Hydrogenedentota bacterium]
MRVKICGITNLEDALAAVDAGADALGFNFAEEAKKKRRYIDFSDAVDIAYSVQPFVTTVAVVTNPDWEDVELYLEYFDRVQFHGEESPKFCWDWRVRAIKAFRVSPDFDPEIVVTYPGRAVLLDAYDPKQRGGTGKTLDWDIARRVVEIGKPVILAGGLTPENVADAIRAVRPYAVDVAGGVESAPGKKDHERIRSFIRNAKNALA